jgi:hypothetical protein
MKFTNILTGETVTPEDWQLALKPGDYYTIESPTLAVAGQRVGPPTGPPTVYGRIENDEDCEPGFFWVQAYSQWCPEGEFGLMNICDPSRTLTEAEFEQARAEGWP